MRGLLNRHHRSIVGALAGLGMLTLSAGSAHAAIIATDACDNATLSQPFAPWGDGSSYKPVPGGSFETGTAGWTLSGGAGLLAGSEPYGATGSVGSWSLSLRAGASAQSPFTCVDAAYPTFRFFAQNDGPLSTLLVSVVYREPLVGEVVLPVGPVALSDVWAPALPMLTASAVPGLLSGGTAQVALRFTEVTGTSQIDDVYVDPRMHNP